MGTKKSKEDFILTEHFTKMTRGNSSPPVCVFPGCHSPNTEIFHASKSWTLSTSFHLHTNFIMSKIKFAVMLLFSFKENTSCTSQWLPWALYSKCALKNTETRYVKCQLKMEFMSVWMRGDITGSFTTPAVMVIAMESYNKPKANRWHPSSLW